MAPMVKPFPIARMASPNSAAMVRFSQTASVAQVVPEVALLEGLQRGVG
jgi:hypothetical protein